LTHTQQSPFKGESFFFFFFGFFPFRYMVTPFYYGYAVSHSEPSTLIPLLGYVSYEGYSHREIVVLYIYDIGLTHIRHLTPLLPKNLKTMWLWAFDFI